MRYSFVKLEPMRSMATTELSLFSIEILGLVGREGAGPHDLLRMAQRGRMLAWAGESQYYTEPKRLAKLGYLEARKEPGKTRERTVYTLTDKGLERAARVREHARGVHAAEERRAAAAARSATSSARRSRAKAMATLRDDLADIAARLDEAESRAAQLAHREKYLLLVTGVPAPVPRAARGTDRRRRARTRPRSKGQPSPTRVTARHPQIA